MRLTRTLALGATVLVLIVGACSSGGSSKPTIKVGSVGFDEARIMAEAYAQVLENAGYTVNRDGIGLGDRSVLLPALESGQIDLQPEYIGSGLGAGYGGTPTGDPDHNKQALQDILSTKGGGITVLDYTPAQDQNAFVVRQEPHIQWSHPLSYRHHPKQQCCISRHPHSAMHRIRRVVAPSSNRGQ